ncbi:MAG: cache domain-containing protein [Candidatus Lernaella stagnicola]|nr:cache domain-containing protein [Candidatus Lernaella stagnicola]
MSIRTALVSAFATIAAVVLLVVALLGISGINQSVLREAQIRTNHNLFLLESQYNQRLRLLAEQVQNHAKDLYRAEKDRQDFLFALKREMNLTVLNVCSTDGRPLLGAYPQSDALVPIANDPVIRRALTGRLAFGTVLLDPTRLFLEGGAALQNAMVVSNGDDAPLTDALFRWVAVPLFDDAGHLSAIVYGGRATNLDFDLVDDLRDVLFGKGQFDGKPLGTVTFFLRDRRVATNVIRENRRRAVGTYVSGEVRQHVLEGGEPWYDRAWVVDAWYLSGYRPLEDPDGRIIGMTYVGLLEAQYTALRNKLLWRFLGPLALLFGLATALSLVFVRRITRPLRELGDETASIAAGRWDENIDVRPGFTELSQLADSIRAMKSALAEHDHRLKERNRQFAEANEKLTRTNHNYMQMLGFVTHELRSPLTANQGLIDVMMQGLTGEVPDKVRELLVRIKRNSEELLDMVKNYLDLSRVERGEFEAKRENIDVCAEVVQPAVDMAGPLFASRNITLTTSCPEKQTAYADAELLRIALTNYLTNAAKYGREGATAHLNVDADEEKLSVSVWNEGEGFTQEQHSELFGKFNRLRNANTRGKRGSGLGLFLTRQILSLHEGDVWAESEPGKWARFGFSIPLRAAASPPPSKR